jgi:predicted transcriptional regulator
MRYKETKPETPDIIVTTRIPREIDAELTMLARLEERTKSAVIRVALREYIKRLEGRNGK